MGWGGKGTVQQQYYNMGCWWGAQAAPSSESQSWTPATVLPLLCSCCSFCCQCCLHCFAPCCVLAILAPQSDCVPFKKPAAPRAWESTGPSVASTTVPQTLVPGVSEVHSLACWAQRSHRTVWELSHNHSSGFFWRRILQIPQNSSHSKSVQLEVPGWVVAMAAVP